MLNYSDKVVVKKIHLIGAILLSTTIHARCYEFELIGEGLMENTDILLVVAQGTQSEVRFDIPLKEHDILIPYLNRWAKTEVILDRDEVNFSTKLLKLKSAQYQVPDPLNMSSQTHIRKLREVKCP